ncbi:MAG: M23 family metallopeptidase [Verrucomicrobiales bacterium]|nr:M23 family metallopeptidase [Verrucomicrobiales bacterium]
MKPIGPSKESGTTRFRFSSKQVERACPKIGVYVSKLDNAWRLTLLAIVLALMPATAFSDSSSRESLVRVTSHREGESTRFFVENLQAADVTVTFEIDSENLGSSVSLPVTRTLSGKERAEIACLSPLEPEKKWKWSYTYYATFGSLEAVHDDACVYSLPYAAGQSFRVSQGFRGKYSHFGPNEFAIDWKMPLGTDVHAARDGIVVAVKDDSDLGGSDNSFDADANFVLIRHADGTLGQYVHLLKGGSQVGIGDSVRVGDVIARSGNTGHSTGPHLHFSVFKARTGKQRETIPVRYRTSNAEALVLETGKSYKAPGTPASYAAPKQPDKGAIAMGGS